MGLFSERQRGQVCERIGSQELILDRLNLRCLLTFGNIKDLEK